MIPRILTGAVVAAGLAAGGLGATTVSASAHVRHPPGPDRCWAWVSHHHHHDWVWVCNRPYNPFHPEIGFYFGFGDEHHRHHDDMDWKKKHPGDGMDDHCMDNPKDCHMKKEH